jgi:hypothetical protein
MTAWLIEAPIHSVTRQSPAPPETLVPRWLGYRSGTLEFAWTANASEAKRFGAETDARVAVNALLRQRPELFRDVGRIAVTEHQWGTP